MRRVLQAEADPGAAAEAGSWAQAVRLCGVCEVSIRTLEDLRGRCVIDDITGCWNWGGTYHGKLPTARVCAGVGGLQEKSRNMSAMRAAWILAGKDVAPRQNVYHAVGCKHS